MSTSQPFSGEREIDFSVRFSSDSHQQVTNAKQEMARYCIVTSSDVFAVKKSDGHWALDGPGAQMYTEVLSFNEGLFPNLNSSFYLTMKSEECLQRIKLNQSDMSNTFINSQTVIPFLHHPEPILAGKTQFISGYAMMEGQLRMTTNSASALGNADLFHPAAYLAALMSVVCFTSFIALRVLVLSTVREEIWSRLKSRRITPFFVIRREISRVFYGSSNHFRLIALMYSMLCFCILTGFLCRFKTSKVVLAKPFYPRTYKQSLDYKPSLAFFYDKFSVVSDQFRDAPRDSIRGKLWAKLQASGRSDEFENDGDRTKMSTLVKMGKEMAVNKSIGIGASFILPFIRLFGCAFSPDDQLYFTEILSDPIEPEFVYGFAVSNEYRFKQLFIRKQRLIIQGDFLYQFFKISSDPDRLEELQPVLQRDREHRRRQRAACTGDESFAPEVEVGSISVHYFKSFFHACLIVWFVAFIINLVHISWSPKHFVF